MMDRVGRIFCRARILDVLQHRAPPRRMLSQQTQPGRWDVHVTQVKRPLPQLPNKKPMYLLGGAALLFTWFLVAKYFNNKERVGTSVLRMVSHRVRTDPDVGNLLGTPVRLKRSMIGDPWINGMINPLRGKVDMSFDVEGPLGVGTVYFTSVRKSKAEPFELLRFLVVPDGDTSRAISLLSHGIEHNMLGDN